MKVAYVTSAGMCCGGGQATYLKNLAPFFHKAGIEMHVYTTGKDSEKESEYPYVNHITIPGDHTTIEARMDFGKKQVLDCATKDYDIIHLSLPENVLFIDYLKDKKTIITHHGSQLIRSITKEKKGRELYQKYLKKLHLADTIVVHSHKTEDIFRKDGGVSPLYLPQSIKVNGLLDKYAEEYSNISQIGLEPDKYFLFIGKLRHEKGPDIAIEAFKKTDIPLKLVIAGPDEFENEYASSLKDMAKGDERIMFPGSVTGDLKHELLTHAYCSINPIRIWAIPLTALEAMAHKSCVISSDKCVHHDIIRDNAIVFKDGDAEDLAQKMKYLYENPEMAKLNAKSGFKTVKKEHNLETLAGNYIKLYKNMLK